MYYLKGGHTAIDPRLGRVPERDERSKAFPARALLTPEQEARPRSYTWRCYTRLDQGSLGACVGFSISQEAAARPRVVADVNDAVGVAVYRRAQQLDEWPGESYEGTSVLAGMKAAAELGWYGEYRWAFSLDELVAAVGHHGPAVLGINWYTDMFNPDADGFVRPTGNLAGGHAILCNGVNLRGRFLWLTNSWSEGWGIAGRDGRGGCAKLALDDADRLVFHEGGDAAIPVARSG